MMQKAMSYWNVKIYLFTFALSGHCNGIIGAHDYALYASL